MNRGMTIGTLAKAAGVNVETVRFYERVGLIGRPQSGSGYRRYDEAHLVRMRYIRAAKALDLSLKEIAALQDYLQHPGSGFCAALRAAVGRRRASIDGEIADLVRRRDELDTFLLRCERRPAGTPCPVVVDLNRGS